MMRPLISGKDAVVHDSARLQQNNFDLLRLVLAAIVVFVHAHDLSGFEGLGWVVGVLSSTMAVQAFFIVSGFLIFMSYERSSTWMSYARKRFWRIYPAYFVVIVLSAFGMYLVTTASFSAYFSSAWLKYLLANLAFLNFLQPTLPGVFDTNRHHAVNGALWTLKLEIMFYVSVPVFVALCRRFSHLAVLAMTYLLSVAYFLLMTELAARTGHGYYVELARQLPGQLAYFVSGGLLYYVLPLFERRVGTFVGAAACVLVIAQFYSLPLLEPLALAVIVLFFALFPYVGRFGKFGDFSYGTYILHFPILQLFLSQGWWHGQALYFMTAVSIVTACGAVAMWYLVERRWIHQDAPRLSSAGLVGALAPKDHVDCPEKNHDIVKE
jgi:peptidoglycan/LPS O-acetylase OafA/YrhL